MNTSIVPTNVSVCVYNFIAVQGADDMAVGTGASGFDEQEGGLALLRHGEHRVHVGAVLVARVEQHWLLHLEAIGQPAPELFRLHE